MIRTLNEIESLVLKAARGAGIPLGHDEDLAAAARYLAGTAPEKLGELTAALPGPHVIVTLTDNGTTIADARVAMAGPMALDLIICGKKQVCLTNLDAPAVFQAMVDLSIYNSRLKAVVDVDGRDVTLAASDTATAVPPQSGPVDVTDADWETWAIYAAKTYVPASDGSRISGAGAGLTDND